MSTEKELYEQKILELEKKLAAAGNDLSNCKKEKEEFIYIAAHELKAPVRKLATFAERLAEKSGEALSEEAVSYLKRLEKTVAGMQSLIDHLTEFADLDTNGEFIRSDLNQLMNEVLKESSELIGQKKATIQIAPLPLLHVDPHLLKVVFKNLLHNSLTFQPKGQVPQINIYSEFANTEEKINFHIPVDKVYYKINFADNGIGFSQENADRIFRPFERLNGKSEYPGNGLGLAICKKIINMHHGIIYAKGNENDGCHFILILSEICQ